MRTNFHSTTLQAHAPLMYLHRDLHPSLGHEVLPTISQPQLGPSKMTAQPTPLHPLRNVMSSSVQDNFALPGAGAERVPVSAVLAGLGRVAPIPGPLVGMQAGADGMAHSGLVNEGGGVRQPTGHELEKSGGRGAVEMIGKARGLADEAGGMRSNGAHGVWGSVKDADAHHMHGHAQTMAHVSHVRAVANEQMDPQLLHGALGAHGAVVRGSDQVRDREREMERVTE
jgi:hypothetical protein